MSALFYGFPGTEIYNGSMKSLGPAMNFGQRLLLTALIALAAALLHSYSADIDQAPLEAQYLTIEQTASR